MSHQTKPNHKIFHLHDIPLDLHQDFRHLAIILNINMNDLFILAMKMTVEHFMKTPSKEKMKGFQKIQQQHLSKEDPAPDLVDRNQ